MRRNMILVLAATSLIGGCGKGALSSSSGAVATVEGTDLKPEWIADVIHGARKQGMVPSLRAAEYLADLWVDMSVFAHAAAADKLSDSTVIADAMWFNTLRFELAQWHDTLVKRKAVVSEAQVDSAIKANDWRMVQHILVTVPPNADAATKAAARKKADGLLAKIRGGADMGDLVAENSDDPGSKATRGFYPPKPKGTYTPEFDKVLWELAPGKISGVVPTSFGFHIIRRASDAEMAEGMVKLRPEMRDSLIARVAPKLTEQYLKELEATNEFKVVAGAPAIVKAALEDLEGKRKDKTKLVNIKGGDFTVADLVRWVETGVADPTQGPMLVDNLKSAPDSLLNGFVQQLADNDMLLAEAHKNKIKMTAEEWAQTKAEYQTGVDSLKASMGLNTIDPKLSGKARADTVAARVDQYFKRIQDRSSILRSPPGILSWVLRGTTKVKFYPDGMKQAVDLAVQQNTADSLKDAGSAAGGAVQPADGPAPLPGAAKPDSGPAGAPAVKKP